MFLDKVMINGQIVRINGVSLAFFLHEHTISQSRIILSGENDHNDCKTSSDSELLLFLTYFCLFIYSWHETIIFFIFISFYCTF